MSLIDGLDIDEGATSYWTSTQYNYEKAWLVTYNGNEFYPMMRERAFPSMLLE